MRCLPIAATLVAIVAIGSVACGFVKDQTKLNGAQNCIDKTCNREVDATAYQQCVAACRQSYGK